VGFSNSPVALGLGESVYVWGKLASTYTQTPINETNIASELIIANVASIAVNLSPLGSGSTPMVTVEIQFDANPGTFEIDVQEADTDADGFYITPTSGTYTIAAVNSTTFVVRADFSPTGGKFFRLFMKTLEVATVKVRGKITRLA
jgi:hypothetical protein